MPILLLVSSASALAQSERGATWAPERWPTWSTSQPKTDGSATAPAASSARDLLRQADDDLLAGRDHAAAEKLEQILERFAETREAALAKDRLLAQFRSVRMKQVAATSPPRDLTSAAAVSSSRSASPPIEMAPAVPGTADTASGRHANRPAPGSRDGLPGLSEPSLASRGVDDFKHDVGDRIFFEAAAARIDIRQRQVLTAQAAWLKARPDAVVRLEGHADDPGARDLNMQLSHERADAVRAVLVKAGVPGDRIEIVALGASRPIALCPGADSALREACAQQNRRVVAVIGWVDPVSRRRLGGSTQAAPATLASSLDAAVGSDSDTRATRGDGTWSR